MDLFTHISLLCSTIFLLLIFTTYTHVHASDELPKRRNHLNGIRRLEASHSSQNIPSTNSFELFGNGQEVRFSPSIGPIASGSFKQRLLNALEKTYEASFNDNLTKFTLNQGPTVDNDDLQKDRWRNSGEFVRRINFLRSKSVPRIQKGSKIEIGKLRESLRRKIIDYLHSTSSLRSQAPRLTDYTIREDLNNHLQSNPVKLRAKIQKIADSTPSNIDPVTIQAISKSVYSQAEESANGEMSSIRNHQEQFQANTNLAEENWMLHKPFSGISSGSIDKQVAWPIDPSFIRRTPFSRHTTSTASPDYHYRSIVPMKKFKFTQKHSHHPRLRIRRPGESFLFRGNQVASNLKPIDLPSLTPLITDSSSDDFYDQKADKFDQEKKSSREELPDNTDAKFIKETRMQQSHHSEPSQIEQATDIPENSGLQSVSPPEEFRDGFGSTEFGRNQALLSPGEFNSHLDLNIPENSGLRSVSPPEEFQDGFDSNQPSVSLTEFEKSISGAKKEPKPVEKHKEDSSIEPSSSGYIFTGESALTPNRNGPTGDGYGPPIFPGAAVPPPVPAVSIGGSAAGIRPYWLSESTPNPPPTLKPSALFNILQKADLGFNQAMTHFEQGTPIEAAAIDILEVALGSQKLDSQAKLLGHIDRAIGLDNLQRFQRWANTGGALDALKEQLVKFAKNYSPPENLLPTIPPQLQYLFSPTGKR